MLDRFTSMQVFLAVVRHGTFAAAAAELAMSRAMASKHIQALEAHLGVRLFNRTTRVTRLSEAGQRYFDRVYDLLTELEHVETRLAEDAARVRGTLTVAAPPAFGAFHLAPVIADYMARYPEVQVHLTLTDRPIDLIAEGVDVAVTVRELEDSAYIARRLSAVRMKLCASPGYLEQHGVPRKPEDLVAYNCLIYSDVTATTHTEWQFQRRGSGFNVKVGGNFVSNVGDALRVVAVAGLGITRLPSYIVRADLSSGRLVTLLDRYSPPLRPVHALYAHRDYVPGKVRSFIDFAVDAFAEDKRRRDAQAQAVATTP